MENEKVEPQLKGVHPKFHRFIFISLIFWSISFFAVSMILYNISDPFSIQSVWISTLGNPTLGLRSPTIFNIGVFITPIFFFIHFKYLFQNLPIQHSWVKIPIEFFLYLGAIGYGSIAIFTDNIQPIHDIMAGFAFGGLGLGYLYLDIIFLKWGFNLNSKNQNQAVLISNKSKIGFISTLIATILFLIVSVGVFIVGGIDYKNTGDWIIIWEWLALFALGLNIVMVAIFTEIIIKLKEN